MNTPRAVCLPFRERNGGLEVLLVRTAKNKRWKLPGRKVKKRLLPRETAALAGYRQAGVTGALSTTSIGHYKRRKGGRIELVFGLEVTEIHRRWPQSKRHRMWMSLEKAAHRVGERKASPVILSLERVVADARLRELLLTLPEFAPLDRN